MIDSFWSFPGGAGGKASLPMQGYLRVAGWIAGLGKSPGGELQQPSSILVLKNPTDRGNLTNMVYSVAKSQAQLK